MESLASGGGLKKYVESNPKYSTGVIVVMAIIIVVLIVLVVYFGYFAMKKQEGMTPFYLDQIAMQYSDPTYMKFAGRDRDILGMSPKDYYLEHDMNANNEVEPQTFTDVDFSNTTDYLQMPRWYRPYVPGDSLVEGTPKTLTGLVMQGGVSRDDDEDDTAVADDAKRLARLRQRSENPETINSKNQSSSMRFLS